MKINRTSLLRALTSYAIWGIAPLYWALLTRYAPLFTLGQRIVWGAVFLSLYLTLIGKWPLFRQTLHNRRKFRLMLLAALFVSLNWGTYIWAMTNAHVLDSSLGYYFNPLVSAIMGVIFFKEKLNRGQLTAYGLAFIGVVIATVEAGRLPLLSLALCFTFAIYSLIKKFANVDPAVSVTMETYICFPFCILYFLTLGRGQFALIDGGLGWLLLIGAGLITATPLLLFAHGVNGLPLNVLGFVQFLSPTLNLICGLILGETMSGLRWFSMLFIWAAAIVFILAAGRGEQPPKLPEASDPEASTPQASDGEPQSAQQTS